MSPEELLEVQQGLEDESRALGRARYRNKRSAPWIDAMGPQIDEASLPPGRRMLRRAIKPTAEAIRDFLGNARSGKAGRRHAAFDLLHLPTVEPEALAYLTLRCAIQVGVRGTRAQSAAKSIGNAVLDHLRAKEFAGLNPKGAEGLQKSLAGRPLVSAKRQQAISALYEAEGVNLAWSQHELATVGLKLIELAIEATGLFDLKLIESKVGKKVRRERRLHLTEAMHDWLEAQHERCELLDPIPLPMVVPPRPWTTPTDGGYLTPPIGTRLVGSRHHAYGVEIENIEMPLVYRAVNAVQATAWKINRRVLEVLESLASDGGSLAGVPPREPEPIPARPHEAAAESEALWKWKREAADVHARNAASRSKRHILAQQLWVARKLADFPANYFPHDLDFRGRVYPIPQGGPHPQAGDIGRSLLEFTAGKPLGTAGARWLAIHLANTFGVDKVGFEERIAWVEQNRALILDSASAPLDGARFWTTADKPWAALAACFEWAGYLAEGETFASHLPIAIDGSNSGLQHLTALLRDANAAPHVNLTPANQPGDIYALVATSAQALCDASSDPRSAPWKNGRITRGIVKRPCMTFVYSATAHGMTEQIRAELARLDAVAVSRGDPPYLAGSDNFTAASWLAPRLFKMIGKAVPAASAAMKWLKSAAQAIGKLDLPLWWTTPAGLPVLQRYPNTKTGRIETTFRGKRLQLQLEGEAGPPTFAEWAEQPSARVMDGRRAINSIAPNFVHSLDAAHLMLTVVAAREAGITDLAVIHDSFGAHASEIDRLSTILRETFVAMYEGDPLGQFRADLEAQLVPHQKLIDGLPPLPPKGDLDLRHILDATYMFA